MIASRTPVSFIATDAPEDTRAFYVDIMGLTLTAQSAYALVFADGAHTLRVQIVQDFLPLPYTVHGWQVADIAAEVAHLTAKGVTFVQFDMLPQERNGVWTTPDGSKIAWFKDPSGNILSLTQHAIE